MVERVSGYDGVELVVGEHEPATAPGDRSTSTTCSTAARSGEPLQYVLGRWQFLGLDLLVDRRVLVPRPETEVVAQDRDRRGRRGSARGRAPHDPWGGGATAFAVADLGTGSGALALALARELPDAAVWATDVSDDALAVARANLAGVGSRRDTGAPRARARGSTRCRSSSAACLRLVVSNPPYVAEHEVPDLPRDVADWEPRDALVSGPSGLRGDRDDRARRAASGSTPPAACWCVELAPHQAARGTGARDRRRASTPSTSSPTSPAASACSSPGVGVVG